MRSQDWIVQKLIEARALIEQGWCQGENEIESDCGTQYCASGAMRAVVEDQTRCYALDYLVRALTLMAGSRTSIPSWNDNPDRTQQEVLALYDRAIEMAREACDRASDMMRSA